LEKSIIDTWSTVRHVKVYEEDPPPKKDVKLTLTMKKSKNTLAKMKLEYEV